MQLREQVSLTEVSGFISLSRDSMCDKSKDKIFKSRLLSLFFL